MIAVPTPPELDRELSELIGLKGPGGQTHARRSRLAHTLVALGLVVGQNDLLVHPVRRALLTVRQSGRHDPESDKIAPSDDSDPGPGARSSIDPT